MNYKQKQWYILLRTPLEEYDDCTQQIIYRSFYNYVYPIIYSMVKDRFFTEDVIQDCFLKASVQIPKLRSEKNILGWIKLVASHIAFDKIRDEKSTGYLTTSINIDTITVDKVNVAKEVENKLRNEVLYKAIGQLKEDYRKILLLYYFRNKRYKEICKELGFTESILTQKMARARKKLSSLFSKKWSCK